MDTNTDAIAKKFATICKEINELDDKKMITISGSCAAVLIEMMSARSERPLEDVIISIAAEIQKQNGTLSKIMRKEEFDNETE